MVSKNRHNTPKSPEELISFVEELKRQWVTTIDSIVDPIMIVKNDYTILRANKALAKMADMNIKDVIGQKCYKAFAGKESPCIGCKMHNASKSKKAKYFSLEEIKGDKYFEVTSQPIFDDKGILDGTLQIYRDRTEAKKMENQLLQSEKLASIGLLAGGVAHEINNPLGGILIFAQMLDKELPPNSRHRDDVTEIINAAKRCKTIVENLLDFARTNKSLSSTAIEEDVDLIEAAKSALRFSKVGLNNSAFIDINENWSKEKLIIKGDRNKFIQVFLNLFQNAFHSMPDGGMLTITSKIKADKNGNKKAVFEISDTGIGISPEDQKHIFDPFFTTKQPGVGTGLGLAICYGIIDEHKGHLSFKSILNEGTTFKITLPLRSFAK